MSLRARLLEFALRAVRLKRMFAGPDAIRRTVALARRRGPALPPPSFSKRFAVSRCELAGSTIYTVAPRHRLPSRRLLYLHGGGFILPIQAPHWQMIATLVEQLDAVATVPFYPLAPEQDESAVWALLLRLYPELMANGGDHAGLPLTIAGDSAGGSLALSLAMQVRDAGWAQPARIVLISPSLDLSGAEPVSDALDRADPILSPLGLPEIARLYAGARDRRDPVVSPLYGSLDGLPPIALFIGTHDILWQQCVRLRDRAAREGKPLAWYEAPGMLHVWPMFPIPEARLALDQMVAFIAGPRAERGSATPG